jgi:hypothetical protein
MVLCISGGPNQPLYRDLQWSIVLCMVLSVPRKAAAKQIVTHNPHSSALTKPIFASIQHNSLFYIYAYSLCVCVCVCVCVWWGEMLVLVSLSPL